MRASEKAPGTEPLRTRRTTQRRSVLTMGRHRIDPVVHPLDDPISRRSILHGLGTSGLAAAGTMLVPNLTRAQDATPSSDLEANKILARRFHDDLFVLGKVDVADEILTPDFTWYAPPQTVF